MALDDPTEESAARPWYERPPAAPPRSDASAIWPGVPPSLQRSTASPVGEPAPVREALHDHPAAGSTTAKRSLVTRIVAGGAVAVLAVAGGFVGGFAGNRFDATKAPTSSAAIIKTVADRTATASSSSSINATAVLDRMRNSVVAIQAQVTSYDGPWSSQGEADGTGIVIDDAGDILTNAHVVAGATSLTVTLPGSVKTRTATLLGSDAVHDVALIHVNDASGLRAATLASTNQVEVGQGVVAIGNALALRGSLTVTQGIVSAVDRSISTEESSSMTGLLQTDAAISSGNSGGPLVDSSGVVIGMNTAVASSSGQVQASNIGFAIPIRTALDEVAKWLRRS